MKIHDNLIAKIVCLFSVAVLLGSVCAVPGYAESADDTIFVDSYTQLVDPSVAVRPYGVSFLDVDEPSIPYSYGVTDCSNGTVSAFYNDNSSWDRVILTTYEPELNKYGYYNDVLTTFCQNSTPVTSLSQLMSTAYYTYRLEWYAKSGNIKRSTGSYLAYIPTAVCQTNTSAYGYVLPEIAFSYLEYPFEYGGQTFTSVSEQGAWVCPVLGRTAFGRTFIYLIRLSDNDFLNLQDNNGFVQIYFDGHYSVGYFFPFSHAPASSIYYSNNNFSLNDFRGYPDKFEKFIDNGFVLPDNIVIPTDEPSSETDESDGRDDEETDESDGRDDEETDEGGVTPPYEEDNPSGGKTEQIKVDVDVDAYIHEDSPVYYDPTDELGKLEEPSKPVTRFLRIFFDFLPAELLALIIGGVAVAVYCRIFGR